MFLVSEGFSAPDGSGTPSVAQLSPSGPPCVASRPSSQEIGEKAGGSTGSY